MSISKCLYLGPYVECTYRAAIRTVTVHGCTSPSCKRHPKRLQPDKTGEFCSACGSRNGPVPIGVDDRPDRYDIVGDELFTIATDRGDILWLAPNVRRKGDPRPQFDDDGEIHLDLRSIDQAAEMAWFEKAFAPELAKLRVAYATVEIKWGMHQFFM
ncbi:MAG TPA: hypothetical protein VFB99_15015 [Vicinamibacterales bacterium]|nr:hypothetical protein [Vicinamibacterales bacterium]